MLRTLFAVTSIAVALTGCSARAGVEVQPAIVTTMESGAPEEGKVWVCHRGRWQEVGEPAAAGHSRHGDVVSQGRRSAGGSC